VTKVEDHPAMATDTAMAASKSWHAPVLKTYPVGDSTRTLASGSTADIVPGFFQAS